MIKIQTDSNQLARNTQRSQTKPVNPACLPACLLSFISSSKVHGRRYRETATKKKKKRKEKERKKERKGAYLTSTWIRSLGLGWDMVLRWRRR